MNENDAVSPRYDYDALMKQLKAYEIIEEEPPLLPSDPKLCWAALLRNRPDAANCFYARSHGDLSIRVRPGISSSEEKGYVANLMIHSVADNSIVLIGPVESKGKAGTRAIMLRAEAEEWDGWIPTKKQVEVAAEKTGCYWNR